MLAKDKIEEQRKHWEEIGHNIDAECSCNECYPNDDDEVACRVAFDIYNLHGECLNSK